MRRDFNNLVNGIVREEARKVQPVFNPVELEEGTRVAEVKVRLRAEANREGYRFSDRELTHDLTAISNAPRSQSDRKRGSTTCIGLHRESHKM